mmetsp:Transcript_151470/g.279292  ORF Transcript_151470/g.279292 Transcript_151470/m.279292 type:complete len:155 (-) Transcript_151470:53-517(-)
MSFLQSWDSKSNDLMEKVKRVTDDLWRELFESFQPKPASPFSTMQSRPGSRLFESCPPNSASGMGRDKQPMIASYSVPSLFGVRPVTSSNAKTTAPSNLGLGLFESFTPKSASGLGGDKQSTSANSASNVSPYSLPVVPQSRGQSRGRSRGRGG